MVLSLATQVITRQSPQLVVDERHQLLQRGGIAFTPFQQ
jgi:hypothetical protein